MSTTYKRVAEIDITEYPIIKVNAKLDSPTPEDAENFIEKLLETVRITEGSFVILVDATHTKWANRHIRTIIGVGFQYLEKEYSERYKKMFLCFPSFKVRFLHALVVNFIKAAVPEKRVSNMQDANRLAKEFISTDSFKSRDKK